MLKATLALILALECEAFYLPGLAPVTYCEKAEPGKCQSEIKLFVNRLNSEESVIPYEYEHFDFCQADKKDSPSENLGQVVFGERIRPSPYQITFGKDDGKCKVVCSKSYDYSNGDSKEKVETLKNGMNLNYQHHWIIDNMPVTWCYQVEGNNNYCSTGFPMGCYVDEKRDRKDACVISGAYSNPDTYYIFNHVDIEIAYHPGSSEDWGQFLKDEGESGGRLVSAKITPLSVNHGDQVNKEDCSSTLGNGPMEIPGKSPTDGKLDIS